MENRVRFVGVSIALVMLVPVAAAYDFVEGFEAPDEGWITRGEQATVQCPATAYGCGLALVLPAAGWASAEKLLCRETTVGTSIKIDAFGYRAGQGDAAITFQVLLKDGTELYVEFAGGIGDNHVQFGKRGETVAYSRVFYTTHVPQGPYRLDFTATHVRFSEPAGSVSVPLPPEANGITSIAWAGATNGAGVWYVLDNIYVWNLGDTYDCEGPPTVAPRMNARTGPEAGQITLDIWASSPTAAPSTSVEIFRVLDNGTIELRATIPYYSLQHPQTLVEEGLASGELRSYRARSINAYGVGPLSEVTVGAAPTPPSVPLNLTLRHRGDWIDLVWDRPASNGGLSRQWPDYYEVWAGAVPGEERLVGSQPYSWASYRLAPGENKYFMVRAGNGVGPGPFTARLCATGGPAGSSLVFQTLPPQTCRAVPVTGESAPEPTRLMALGVDGDAACSGWAVSSPGPSSFPGEPRWVCAAVAVGGDASCEHRTRDRPVHGEHRCVAVALDGDTDARGAAIATEGEANCQVSTSEKGTLNAAAELDQLGGGCAWVRFESVFLCAGAVRPADAFHMTGNGRVCTGVDQSDDSVCLWRPGEDECRYVVCVEAAHPTCSEGPAAGSPTGDVAGCSSYVRSRDVGYDEVRYRFCWAVAERDAECPVTPLYDGEASVCAAISLTGNSEGMVAAAPQGEAHAADAGIGERAYAENVAVGLWEASTEHEGLVAIAVLGDADASLIAVSVLGDADAATSVSVVRGQVRLMGTTLP